MLQSFLLSIPMTLACLLLGSSIIVAFLFVVWLFKHFQHIALGLFFLAITYAIGLVAYRILGL